MHRAAQIGRQRAADDDRLYLPGRAYALQELQAVHALHLQVAQGNVYAADVLQQGQCLRAVTGFVYQSTPQALQDADRNRALERMVFEHQNSKRLKGHVRCLEEGKFAQVSCVSALNSLGKILNLIGLILNIEDLVNRRQWLSLVTRSFDLTSKNQDQKIAAFSSSGLDDPAVTASRTGGCRNLSPPESAPCTPAESPAGTRSTSTATPAI